MGLLTRGRQEAGNCFLRASLIFFMPYRAPIINKIHTLLSMGQIELSARQLQRSSQPGFVCALTNTGTQKINTAVIAATTPFLIFFIQIDMGAKLNKFSYATRFAVFILTRMFISRLYTGAK